MVTAISSSRCLSCLGAARRHLSPKHRELALQVLRLCGSIQLLLLLFLDSGLVDPISFRDFLSFDSFIVRFDDLCAKLWYVLCVLVSCVFGISKVLAPSSHAFCCHAFCVHSQIFSWRWNSLFPKFWREVVGLNLMTLETLCGSVNCFFNRKILTKWDFTGRPTVLFADIDDSFIICWGIWDPRLAKWGSLSAGLRSSGNWSWRYNTVLQVFYVYEFAPFNSRNHGLRAKYLRLFQTWRCASSCNNFTTHGALPHLLCNSRRTARRDQLFTSPKAAQGEGAIAHP